MRGEICVGTASFLAFVSLLLLIFVHVSQINTSTVPRSISLVKVNVSSYGNALHAATFDPIDGLYTNNSSASLESNAGLRQFYLFGLYSHCAYVNDSAGTCTNHSIQNQFQPYSALTSDMLLNYTDLTNFILSGTPFANSDSLGHSSRAAYWMLLLGTICAALALLTGIPKNNLTFFISTGFAIIGSIFILIGASIWTAMIKKAQSVNGLSIGTTTNPVPVGIEVTIGPALFMIWAAFASLFASIIPYMVSCCTYRG
ncbi:actin cortical patch SUR7/pH-response regulator pali [Mycena maculata]|uniref:Actin cortical patch SUR7/pH-response regulator pali n=1 Tax=Mycena maculata TaxID=230809 RepID=A0AAD7JS88_9AGAR|nr:actin cortical patch SUR7/pH-response regulator pali [Mycena maculata]